MLFAILTDRIVGIDMPGAEMGVGLRGVRVCGGGQCASVSQHTTLGSVAFFIGLLSVAAILGAAVMDRVHDDDRYWRPAGVGALLWLLSVALWYFEMPGNAFLSLGAGFYAAIVGTSLVSSASWRPSVGEIGAIERTRTREQEIEEKLAAFASPTAQNSTESQSSEGADEEAAGGMAPPEEVSKVALRFIAKSLQIRDDGVVATRANGTEVTCPFADFEQVIARQLPRELGRGPVPLLHIVPRGAQGEPIRVLPETNVNYAYLPKGASDDMNENVQQFIALALALQPEVGMDEGSRRFAEGASRPLPFQSLEHFWEYDSRYPKV